jgi:hypothetical protein
MSRLHSTRRRIALLAGSSLTMAMAAIVLTPSAVQAQTVACVAMPLPADDPPAGNGTGSVILDASTYDPGITCGYTGVGASVETNGPLTVSTTGGVPGDPLVNGINLSATGASTINWDSSDGAITASAATNGPVIEALSASGAISIRTGAIARQSSPTASAGNSITDGIHASSSAGGAINIVTQGEVNIASSTQGDAGIQATTAGAITINAGVVTGRLYGINAHSTGGGAVSVTTAGRVWDSTSFGDTAIWARSTAGNGSVHVNITNVDNAAVIGRLYGIRAQASGTGALTIDHTGGIRGSGANAVAMDIVAGTGLVTVNGVGNQAMIGYFEGAAGRTALRADYDGNALFNLNQIRTSPGSNWGVDLSTTAGTTTTINLADRMITGSGERSLRLRGGADLVFNVTGLMQGRADLTDAGQVEINLMGTGRWRTSGEISLGAAGDTLTIGADAYFSAVESSAPLFDITQIAFGGGDDLLTNAGLLVVGDSVATNPGSDRSVQYDLRLLDLERFENTGLILMGTDNADFATHLSDLSNDDLLFMSGTTFVGGTGSLVVLDADLNATQSSCDSALRSSVTGALPAADCIRIEDGATEGVTALRVNEMVPGDRGSFGEIVLVDVSGGTSASGHFVLDPQSSGYSAANGGVIDKGFFIYPLVYDAETQQHKLVGTVGQNALQFPIMGQAAHDLWRLSTGSWLGRQADLRGGLEEGVGGGVWLRVSTEFADRDVTQTVLSAGNPISFDNTHIQSSYAVTGGFDLISGSAGDSAWVVGLTAGYAHAGLDFDASPNAMRLDGWTGGGYASFISGGWYVDATVTGNKLELEGDVPGLNLFPSSTMVDTALMSVGGQVETGWRFNVMEAAFVEPLAGVSHVRTRFDDLSIAADDPLRPPLVLEFDDPTSLRGNVGARFGLDQDYGVARVQYSLLARFWNEFEDESRVVAYNTGADATMIDEFTGQYSEFGVGASLWALDGVVSGFVNVGGKFGDDYTSQTLAAGVRVNW